MALRALPLSLFPRSILHRRRRQGTDRRPFRPCLGNGRAKDLAARRRNRCTSPSADPHGTAVCRHKPFGHGSATAWWARAAVLVWKANRQKSPSRHGTLLFCRRFRVNRFHPFMGNEGRNLFGGLPTEPGTSPAAHIAVSLARSMVPAGKPPRRPLAQDIAFLLKAPCEPPSSAGHAKHMYLPACQLPPFMVS